MFEMVTSFLKYTGIKEDTFGRLVLNDAWLVEKLRRGLELTDEAQAAVIEFMNRYEDAKE